MTQPALREVMTAPAETEAGFQQWIEQYARWHGWQCYHTRISVGSAKGFPDLVLVRDDRLIFAEVKNERGKVSETQRHWLEMLMATAASVFVWRPRDRAAIEQILE